MSTAHEHPESDPHFEFGSSPFKLDLKDWLAVLAIVSVAALGLPALFENTETFAPEPEYRVHHEQSNDYWSLARWTRAAAAKPERVLVLGDSAIWGHYVDNAHTLTAQLNRRACAERFGNLGVSGMHATALYGLVHHYGSPIRDQRVVLQFAPLWSTSLSADLQDAKESRFHHPKLCPQFLGAPTCYQATVEDRLGVAAQRSAPMLLLSDHMMNQYLENRSLAEWTLEHPYENPLTQFRLEIPGGPAEPTDPPRAWQAKGMPRQDFEWVLPAQSYQWANFKRTVEVLQGRGNRVFVLLGPFNPHILTEASLARYRALQHEVEALLDAQGLPYAWAAELPAEGYGDASHPLAAGYETIAGQLWEDDSFARWLEGKEQPGPLARRP